MIVNSELYQVLNRLLRNQPRTPTLVTGGLSCSLLPGAAASLMIYLSTSAVRLLYQFMNNEVDRLKNR